MVHVIEVEGRRYEVENHGAQVTVIERSPTRLTLPYPNNRSLDELPAEVPTFITSGATVAFPVEEGTTAKLATRGIIDQSSFEVDGDG